MRKIYNICLFVGVIALMLSACKKDNQNQIVQNTGEEIYWTAEDLKIQNNILSFQDKIKNNSFKSGETLELDSAVWYLEALMNYNYSTPDSSFVNLTVDTTFEFNLPVNDDLVDFSNLSEAAFAMEEHIVNYLNNMPNSIKFMIVADVHIKDDDFKSGSKTISITTGYGSEYIDNPVAYTPFGADDYWKFDGGINNQGGYCDGPNQGQSTDSDFSEEIKFKINNPNYQFVDPFPDNSYLINIVTVAHPFWEWDFDYQIDYEDYINPDDETPNDGYLDYLLLLQNGYADCIDPVQMNFYLQGYLDIAESEKQKLSNLTGKDYHWIYTDLISMYFGGGAGFSVGACAFTYGELYVHVPTD